MALTHPPLVSGGASGVSQASVQPREEANSVGQPFLIHEEAVEGAGDEAPPLRPPHPVRCVTSGKLLHLPVPQPTPP